MDYGKAYRNLNDEADNRKGRAIAYARAMHQAARDFLTESAKEINYGALQLIRKRGRI